MRSRGQRQETSFSRSRSRGGPAPSPADCRQACRQFESMPCAEIPFYNNDLWMAVQGVSSEPVSADFPVKQGKNREFWRF